MGRAMVTPYYLKIARTPVARLKVEVITETTNLPTVPKLMGEGTNLVAQPSNYRPPLSE